MNGNKSIWAKRCFFLLIITITISGCMPINDQNEYEVSFLKKEELNNVFEKSLVNCSFYATQMISGKPNYGGDGPIYDGNSLEEGFQIINYPSPSGDTFNLKIAGLNSDKPSVTGNSGEEDFISLNGNMSALSTKLFLEEGPAENDAISAYNISKNGSVIWTKTSGGVEPFSIVHVGYCE